MTATPKVAAFPNDYLERDLIARGFDLVAGVDEVGRGSWAGPLVAAAVILPLNEMERLATLDGVQDSKLLSPEVREKMSKQIELVALSIGIGQASQEMIDRCGLTFANRHAMLEAVTHLSHEPSALIIDHLSLSGCAVPQVSIPRAESQSISVAAASIVAKVFRDSAMIEWGRLHPDYGFEFHKGYGTARHRSAIARHGVCPLHRRSFEPVAAHLR